MKQFLRHSIARRVFISLLLACALAWVAIYLLGLYLVNRSNAGNFDREMLTLADTLRDIAKNNSDPAALAIALSAIQSSIESETRMLGVPPGFQDFHVRTADGVLVGRSAAAPDVHLSERERIGFSTQMHGDKKYRTYALWSDDGKYRIELMQSIASRKAAFNYVMMSREGLLLPLLVGFPVLLVPIWIAVRLGLRPVRRLSKELALRQPGDLAPIAVPAVDAELRPLVEELNQTFARLRELLQRERAFLADAAHEMRTPLALIATQADILLLTQEPQSREEVIRRLHGGIARCSRLVNQLLELARLEAHSQSSVEPVDVADVIRDCLAAHAHEAGVRGVTITYEGPDHYITKMPRHALESALDNVVSNAVRYVQRSGRVVVELASHPDGSVQLSVSDDGPGIAAQDSARIFERFRRGLQVSASGSGLGLAIAASAVRQFGASIDVRDGLDGRGACFCIAWRPQA